MLDIRSDESIKALLRVLGGHWPLLGAATSSWRPPGLKIAHCTLDTAHLMQRKLRPTTKSENFALCILSQSVHDIWYLQSWLSPIDQLSFT